MDCEAFDGWPQNASRIYDPAILELKISVLFLSRN